ncbi:roadblock/LC7 domain-containing protein [Deinococcus gobiensis]|uniref:Roadblock/LC7 n=1 Tax=Deinococcus gobiensis (strain DSM 21396 / JCM 16679 / CGMCC 1.7299 / I-0) TaxID=745776 RepID=H8GZC3_DEIGI|nr:roadblock/LC7 domain-containing protein [Deinococcus gobiensis]AFD24971.1 Roadblock/LC7 [Deinococcus gobiensis I-0]
MKLDPLRTLPGLVAAGLVGRDGLALETVGEGGEALAAELAALRAGAERVGRRLGAGTVSRFALTGDGVEILALTSGDYVLGAALTRGVDTRPAGQVLARLIQDLTLPEDADD